MAQRYDLISPRSGKGDKTFYVRVGTAFASEQGGFNIYLDALPLADKEGRVVILMREPRERTERPARGGDGEAPPF